MTDLSGETIRKWRELLPDDFKRVVPEAESIEGGDEAVMALFTALCGAPPSDWGGILVRNAPTVRSMGRGRRIRMLAWMSGRTLRTDPDTISRIVEIGSEEDGGSGDGVGILFLEDIKALNEVVAARIARRMTNDANIDAIWQASLQITEVPEFRLRGM